MPPRFASGHGHAHLVQRGDAERRAVAFFPENAGAPGMLGEFAEQSGGQRELLGRGELLQHGGGGRRGDTEARGDLAAGHPALAVDPERVHRLRVVLYGLRIRHV